MELCQNVYLFLIVYIEGIIGFDQLAVMETTSPSPLTTAGEDTEHLTGSSNSNLSQHIGNLSDSVIVLQVDGVGNEGDEVDQSSFDAVADAVTIIIRSPTTSPPQHPFSVETEHCFVRLARFGGTIEVSLSRDFHANETIRLKLMSLTEKALNDQADEDGELDMVSSSQTTNLTDGKVMWITMTEPTQGRSYPGSNATARKASFQGVVKASTSHNGSEFIICVINIEVYIFKYLDVIFDGDYIIFTYPGLVQIDLSITDYNFCEDNSTAYMTHCTQRKSHSLEFRATVEPVIPKSCREDRRGVNYMYFGGVGYVIIKQKVKVDNDILPLEYEDFIVHTEEESKVGIHLTVPRFEKMVTMKINIDFADSSCDLFEENNIYIRFVDDLKRGLIEYRYSPTSQDHGSQYGFQDDEPVKQYESTSIASKGLWNCQSLKLITFNTVFLFMYCQAGHF